MILLCVVVFAALLLDYLLAEVKRYHPLVGFGAIVSLVEGKLNHQRKGQRFKTRSKGVLAYLLVVLPIVALSWGIAFYVSEYVVIHTVFSAFVLYVAIGWRSLLQHAIAISNPLTSGDLQGARTAVSMIVSRDTSSLQETEIASAATESVLENGADAIFSAIFWFLIAGIPGVVLYRLSNTLDAMWGYKTERFLHFGWFAARVDDVLNFIPARLTALSYALVGNTRLALKCWKVQGRNWKSPNAGPVMAAGAGALSVSLGGAAPYHGEWQARPHLGPLRENAQGKTEQRHQASAPTIERACALVNKALILWLLALIALSIFLQYLDALV